MKNQKDILVAEITVTHGLFIDEIYGLITEKPITEWCDYCAITAYKLT